MLPPSRAINEHNQFTDTKPQITSSLIAQAVKEAPLRQHMDTGKVFHAEVSILACKLKQ